MSMAKNKQDLAVSLNPSSCYFLRTGQCSLDVVTDYYITPSAQTAPDDLLYCPRLFRAMQNRERMKPITVTPCVCGHAQVLSGRQRACIAAKRGLELAVRTADGERRKACKACTLSKAGKEEAGGDRIITITVLAELDGEEDQP